MGIVPPEMGWCSRYTIFHAFPSNLTLKSIVCVRRRENQEQDTSGFVTLEALMLARQEEERRAQSQLQEQPPPPPPPTVNRGEFGIQYYKVSH